MPSHSSTSGTVVKTLFVSCQPDGSGRYDVSADGFVRGYDIGQLAARLIAANTDTVIVSAPLAPRNGSPTQWEAEFSSVNLAPTWRYVLEIVQAAMGTPLDHWPIIPS